MAKKRLLQKIKRVLGPSAKSSDGRKSDADETSDKVRFDMPDPENYDFYDLDPLAKRKMTICNLFANHSKSVPEIVDLLEVSRKLVIDTLVESKLLKDRRKIARPRTPAPEELRMKR